MDKYAFRQVRRSVPEVLAFLQDPATAAAVSQHLSSVNGGALPSSGVIGGQSVSTTLDYLLGLRDSQAVMIKDIDWFRTATHAELWQTRVADRAFYRWLAENVFKVEGHSYHVALPGVVSTDILCLMEYCNRAYPAQTQKLNRFLWRDLPDRHSRKHKDIRGALWRDLLAIPDNKIQSIHATLRQRYREHSSLSRAHLDDLGFSGSPTCAALPAQLVWDEAPDPVTVDEDGNGYTSALIRPSVTLYKGDYNAMYAVLAVRPDKEAVQPIWTSPVRLVSREPDLVYTHKMLLDNNGNQLREWSDKHSSYVEFLTETSAGYGFGVVAGFDINSVQVGLDLATQRLVYTGEYASFLCDRELRIVNTYTPVQSAVRALSKSELGACYFNQDRMVRSVHLQLAARCYTVDMDQDTATHVVKLQERYDAIRRQPKLMQYTKTSRWFPVLLSKAFAEKAYSYPIIEKHFTVESSYGNGRYVLVPRKAEEYQLASCLHYRRPTVDYQQQQQATIYPPVPLVGDMAQVLAQKSEMSDRWKTRLDNCLAILRRASGRRSIVRNLMTQALKQILNRKLDNHFAHLLDDQSVQPVLQEMAPHEEVHRLFPTTIEQAKSVLQQYQRGKKAVKPLFHWAEQIRKTQLEAQTTDTVAEQLAIQIESFPDRIQDTMILDFVYDRHHWSWRTALATVSTANLISTLSELDPHFSRAYENLLAQNRRMDDTSMPNAHTVWATSQLSAAYLSASHYREWPQIGDAIQDIQSFIMGCLTTSTGSNFPQAQSAQQALLTLQAFTESVPVISKNGSELFESVQEFYQALQKVLPLLVRSVREAIPIWSQTLVEDVTSKYPEAFKQPELSAYAQNIVQRSFTATPATVDINNFTQCMVNAGLLRYEISLSVYGLTTLMSLSECRTADVTPLNISSHWDAVVPAINAKDLTCTELLSDVALAIEGKRQGHCVGSYFDAVNSDRSRILTFTVKAEGRDYRATAEWRRSGDRIVCQQLQGPRNQTPYHILIEAHNKLLQKVNHAKDVWI